LDKNNDPDTSSAEARRRLASFPSFSSGSATLDGLLGGGYKAGRVYEVFGKSNSGKSQLAMQAVLLAAKEGERALFVDSEGTFRPERLEQIAKSRGWDSKGLLERIAYVRTDSAAEQMELVRRMEGRAATAGVRLVAIDTLTRNFSIDMPGRTNMASRQGALDVHLSEMARDAFLSGRAYVLTNRVTFGPTHDVSIGGSTVDQLVHASVRLDRQGAGVAATLLPSGRHALLGLGEGGVD
jgi:DNA repair protein RadA